MLWLGSPFCPDTRWWASTLERPNRQHCHPHGNKNKKSPLAPSSGIAVVSPSILEPSLHARIAAACSTATVLPCGGINPYTLMAKLGLARISGSSPPKDDVWPG